jgi:hypothetical protein
MDIEQAAMHINAARKTSRRSCCSVRQLYTRSIVQPSPVRIVVPAPRRMREIVRQWIREPPAPRHFSTVLPANVSYGGCDLLFRNARVLRCWPIEPRALSSAPILDERHLRVVGKSDSAFHFPIEQNSIEAKPEKIA